MPTAPTPMDRSTARVTLDTLEMVSRVSVISSVIFWSSFSLFWINRTIVLIDQIKQNFLANKASHKEKRKNRKTKNIYFELFYKATK